MIFWCSGSGVTFDWPFKLVPWYVKPRGGAHMWMIDSGVQLEPPSVEQLVGAQVGADYAVGPDVLGDAEATAERTSVWWPQMRRLSPKTKLVLGTQGSIDSRLRLMDRFPDADMIGVGMWRKSKDEAWTDAEREDILRAVVPEAHARGIAVHVFGIGCSASHMSLLRELGVDSFDSSALVQAAAYGIVLNAACKQVRVGGYNNADAKRLRLYLSLSNLRWAMENGPEE